jgi:hypothetical protein
MFVQKRLETWVCVMPSRCTVAVDNPASLKIRKKLIIVVTIATKPKSRGESKRAKISVEPRVNTNWQI